ncbi:MAG: DNA polymerase III subunit delta' [Zoogloeaceae bacterium]|jgi:DNA polymerase-3 subunit delta'|nr:DNA polymerase III subunit delta' [Zoogloeaceae bacterium]
MKAEKLSPEELSPEKKRQIRMLHAKRLHARSWRRLQEWRARLPHALLFSGERGLGKSELALAFAASLLCEKPQAEGAFCGECLACHWFFQGSHPDFRLLQPAALQAEETEDKKSGKGGSAGSAGEGEGEKEKSTRAKQQITIDQIRELDEFLCVGTHRQKSRVILIQPAERMNREAANALLKMLEEPPPDTLFLLVASEPMRLMPTLRSRCQSLRLSLPSPEESEAFLAEAGLRDAATWLALAGGAPLLALQLSQKTADWQPLLTEALQRGGRLDALQVAERLEKSLKAVKGENPLPWFVDWAQKWLVDLNLAAQELPIRFYLAERAKIMTLAKKSLPVFLARFYRQLSQLRRESAHPLNLRLFLEQFFLDYRALFPEEE